VFSLFDLTTCLGISLNPATRLSNPSKKNNAKESYPKIASTSTHNTLTSEKKVYTDAKDITHWVMREEQRPRPSLNTQTGSEVGHHGAATEGV
jgi:hypothetical protein